MLTTWRDKWEMLVGMVIIIAFIAMLLFSEVVMEQNDTLQCQTQVEEASDGSSSD